MDPSLAAGPVTDIVKAVAVPVAHRLAHMICFRKKVDELTNFFDANLGPEIEDLKKQIKSAEDNGEEIFGRVMAWLKMAETAEAKISKLNDDVLKVNSCFSGWFFERYRLGKKAHKEILIVGEILQRGVNVLNRPISRKREIEAVPIQGFEVFGSRESSKHEILEALKVNKMVGVWGMGGIGKTTLMRHILKHCKKEQLFDKVAMAVVSQVPKLKEIQTEIAEGLGMKLDGESIQRRAEELYLRLTHGNNLVLLDDMWEKLDLQDLGIPQGCKLVLTTRSSEVCRKMEVQATIEVKTLSSQESWALFERDIGDYINLNVSKEMAMEVAEECKGMPLAIITLANSLRNTSYDRWVDAANQLKKSRLDDISPVVTSIKYSYDNLQTKERKLYFLFFCLYPEDAMIRIDDLLGYIMGNELFSDAETLGDARRRLNAEVVELISLSLLLKGKNNSYVMVHDIVRDVGIWITDNERKDFTIKAGVGITKWPPVIKSIRTCLWMSLMKNDISDLQGTPECPQLLMLSLADNGSLAIIPNGFFKGMEKLITLDLSGTRISSFSLSILCLACHLRTLLLNNNSSLKDISRIGSLRQLEILDLSSCDLRRLPEEMKSLTKLKLLNLSNNRKLAVIPPNVISSLTFLEEFYMFDSFKHWNSEGEANRGNASFSELLSLPWLSTLHVGTNQDSLICMDYQFKLMKLSKFNINLSSSNASISNYSKTLTIKVNDHIPVSEWVKALWKVSDKLFLLDSGTMEGIFTDGDGSLNKFNALKMYKCSMINLPCELMVNLQNLKSIEIKECNNLKAINSEGDVRQLKVMCNNLESIKISTCDSMEVLFDFKGLKEEGNANALSKLKKIFLLFLGRLEKIWKGSVSFKSIHNLKEMTVKFCNKLSYLFPISMVRSLEQLEILQIEGCPKMVQLFGWEEEEVNESSSGPEPSRITALLPRLKYLKISQTKLSNLDISFPSLEELKIWNCDKLEEVFNSKEDSASLLSPLLIKIEIFRLAIWKESIPVENFHNLKEVKIVDCNNLSYIFLVSAVMSLQQLEMLEIQDCDKVVHIIGSDEEEKEERKTEETVDEIVDTNCCMIQKIWGRRKRRGQEPLAIGDNNDEQPSGIKLVLPRLKTLQLSSLNKFIGFCQQSSIVFYFPSLEDLEIKKCGDLKRLPFDPNSTPKLKIWDCDRLEEVFHSEGHKEDDSASLQSSSAKIDLYRLPKLTAIWKGLIPKESFQNLIEIEIYECKSLSYIFPISAVMSLQQLEVLQIGYCNEMVHIFGSDEEEKEERETEETGDEIVDTNCCMIQKSGIRRRRHQEPSPIGDNNDGQPLVIKAVLQQLRTLQLSSLNQLIGLCQQSSIVFYFPSLEELEILDCAYLRRLPCGPNNMPELKEFRAKMGWFDGLEWEDQSTKARLQSLLVEEDEKEEEEEETKSIGIEEEIDEVDIDSKGQKLSTEHLNSRSYMLLQTHML